MNSLSCIIQILEIPTKKFYKNDIEMVNFRVQLPYMKNQKHLCSVVSATIWGKLSNDLIVYYRKNDYALIEGYFSIKNDRLKNKQKMVINITKLYPFLFKINKENEVK